MSRLKRVYYQNAVYHVYNRGNNHEQVFEKDEIKKLFLDLLGQYRERFGFKVYAYVLMQNHYHLIIETNSVNHISKVMHAFLLSFGGQYRYFNKYRGHLWQSRFKSRLIEDEKYFLEVVEYVHQNPVKAGVVDAAEDYSYCSARQYSGAQDNKELFTVNKWGHVTYK